MKILSAEQIRAADQYTIEHEPISSVDLMERAALSFCAYFTHRFPNPDLPIFIFCGKGNNGGDGLCIARMLHQQNYAVSVFILEYTSKSSPDFAHNLERLEGLHTVPIYHLLESESIQELTPNCIIIDAIFGSGLSRKIEGFTAEIVEQINHKACQVVAVDLPSGLYADKMTDSSAIQADLTISFQVPKLSFLLPQNQDIVGEWQIVPIGLHPDYLAEVKTHYHYSNSAFINNLILPKGKFWHKGKNGHALVIGGSYGKMGAVVLMTKATLKAGAGLVTTYIPEVGYTILQTTVPEAMCITDPEKHLLSKIPPIPSNRYQSIAIGPGIGTDGITQECVLQLLKEAQQPLVLDADALNIIAQNRWQHQIPPNSILTPHPKEFERLFGKSKNDDVRLAKLKGVAQKYQVIIVLKGAHTCVALPSGDCYFNSTGNPAMATAGSGDVLTGIIAAFLAQVYTPAHAAILGVYFHGLAGDIAAEKWGNILAGQLIESLRIPRK